MKRAGPNYPSDLRIRRIKAGLTLEDLSDRTGLSASMISQVERGLKRASREAMQTIEVNISDADRYRTQFGGAAVLEPYGWTEAIKQDRVRFLMKLIAKDIERAVTERGSDDPGS